MGETAQAWAPSGAREGPPAGWLKGLAPGRASLGLFWLLGGAYAATVLAGLPRTPLLEPDSEGYLTFGDYRAPGYPVFLDLHRALFGGLDFLPQTQTGVFLLGLMALGTAVSLMARNILGAAFILLVGAEFAPGADYAGVMSETVYAGWVCLALAAFILGVHRRSWLALCLAGAFVGLVAATRTTGYVFVVVFALCLGALVFQRRERLARALAALVPTLAVMLAAAAYTQAHHGQFRISAYGGMSWLGHGLMVARPLPSEEPLSRLNWVAKEAAPAQADFERVDDLWLKMLVLRQYYWQLRWNGLYDRFEARWPAWAGTPSEFERAELAGRLGKTYLRNAPAAYARLVLLDYLSLWTLPRYLTTGEQKRMAQKLDGVGRLALISDFAATEAGRNPALQVVPPPQSRRTVWGMRLVSGGFFLATLAAAVMLLMGRLPLASPLLAPALLAALSVHLGHAAKAVVESGGERLVFAAWPMMTAGLVLVTALLLSALRAGRGEAPPA